MNRLYFLILFSLIVLAACAPDPRREAAAFATRAQAEQDAADRTQSRDQNQELHDLQVQNVKAEQAAWQSAMTKVIHAFEVTAPIALTLIVLAAGVGLSWALIGAGKATARYVVVRANLIPLNAATRQFPLLIQYIGKGQFTLTNPNTNATLQLDTRNEPDRQMILAAGNVQYAGALAHESRLSLKPGEVSIIPAPFTEVLDEASHE